MSLINWNNDLSVKVKKFDDQHKELIKLINDLHDAMKSGKSNDVMKNIISGLLSYTEKHFSEEEKEMEKAGYSGLEEQLKYHQIFIEKIKEFKRDLENNKIGLSIQIINFLKDWLINHIKGMDAKYGDFFNEKGIK